jgi:predicted DNA-binding transcriptional regulator AlpA
VTANTDIKPQPLPADLAAVALIDAPTCAAAGAMSVSWWHEEVRAGRAPKPAIQQPRCTRWRLVDVARFWADRAGQAAADSQAGAGVKARATKASAAARAKRMAGTVAATA